jgi:hypothetical protein
MSEPRDPEMMRRREILQRAAWLLGGAVSAPAALAFLQGCSRQEPGSNKAAWVPQYLQAKEVAIVTAIADIMIPKTDTSGALDADVPAFIDTALLALYPQPDRDRFRVGVAAFADLAKAQGAGKPFLEQEPQARVAFVRQTLETALAAKTDPKPFILTVRELTLLGYLSSRVGITENMEYVPVPTAFHGCVPLSQMKKHVYWE